MAVLGRIRPLAPLPANDPVGWKPGAETDRTEVCSAPKEDTAPRGAAGGGWRKPDFQSVRGPPSPGMPGGNSLLAARKAVMLTMPQTIVSKGPDAEEWMS